MPQSQSASADNLIFSSGTIIERQDGRQVWELHAQSIETNLSTRKARLFEVSGIFYNENENENSGKVVIAAETAILDTDTKNIELNDNVKITGHGATLDAPHARWDGSNRRFSAFGGINMQREDIVITGESIEASPDLEEVVVKGRAKIVKGGN